MALVLRWLPLTVVEPTATSFIFSDLNFERRNNSFFSPHCCVLHVLDVRCFAYDSDVGETRNSFSRDALPGSMKPSICMFRERSAHTRTNNIGGLHCGNDSSSSLDLLLNKDAHHECASEPAASNPFESVF